MSDLEKIRDSTDEGELSDGSDRSMPKHRKRNEKGTDKSRKRIVDRITFSNHSDDESGEMFTIQPGDSKSRSHDKDRKDREKHSSKHKHERKDERRERDRETGEERHRSKHEDRHRRRDAKYEDKKLFGEKKDKDRERKDKDREKKDKKSHIESKPESGRKHKRSASPPDDIAPEKKREKKPSESKEKKEDPVPFFGNKDKPAKAIEVQEIEHTPPSENPLIVDEALMNRDSITSFTLDSPAGPKKYSKFDSSPEHEVDTPEHSPIHSDNDDLHSDADEAEEEEPEIIDEPSFDAENAVWEELTEDQKASLTPDSKKRLEGEWQKRLISQLPVFYPGIMGCRNVQEFHCENRVEEGTYGVVFRAKDKRTDEIVALKRLKMEKEREGFPITSLREINMLLKAGNHPNIVNVKEVVIGSNMDKIYVAMEFVEHDLKSLMETMKNRGKSFTVGVQKGLMQQLLSGIAHMHKLWILHRDLKSSNLLLSHKGILKIADFGLAREFGSPLKPYTPIVVTLWYRAPELLLGTKLYSTPIDMWSVGCLMGEFVLQKPLFPGRSEQEEVGKIFYELGTPHENIWPGYSNLPMVKEHGLQLPQYTHNQLRKKFPAKDMKESGFQLLNAFLRYDPEMRISAEDALKHAWFREDPLPTPSDMFPTFPAKSEMHKAPPPSRRPPRQPQPEIVVNATTAKLMADLNVRPREMAMANSGFNLKFTSF